MEFEDIITGIVAILFTIVGIIARASRPKGGNSSEAQQEGPTIDEQSSRDIARKWREITTHPDSSEKIFDEVAVANNSKIDTVKVSQKRRGPQTKNATNRTFSKTENKQANVTSEDKKSNKFNLRDAVIYSEILTPKFRDKE
jgi:hypothetical protein